MTETVLKVAYGGETDIYDEQSVPHADLQNWAPCSNRLPQTL